MSKTNKVKGVISMAILAVLLIMVIDWSSLFRYDTPEEAVLKNNKIKVEKVVKTYKFEDVGIVFYKLNDATMHTYVFRDNSGWSNHNSNKLFTKTNREIKGYYINTTKYNNKYIIEIDNSLKNDKLCSVRDNNDSTFSFFWGKYYELTNNKWFTVLENLPDDYTVYIDGEAVKIN